jgi:hypothetical protein
MLASRKVLVFHLVFQNHASILQWLTFNQFEIKLFRHLIEQRIPELSNTDEC